MAKQPSIRSRKHTQGMHPFLGTSLVALGALTAASNAGAQAGAAQEGKALEEVSVKASRLTSFKADESASNKITQPLLDTPKAIQVVKKEMLKEQGAASLMDALRNTPGITMQLGEGGNTSAGDAFQMRGFSTQQSTFVDGVRDLGAVSRDIFNLEQVEVVKGPSGADVGRGAASGYINLISKLPALEDASEASLTIGSADKKRATVDLNRVVGEGAAFRLNAMIQDSGVPGRDFVSERGHAIAPALSLGLGTPTRIHLYSLHQRQNNLPDGGVPTIGLKGFYRGAASATTTTPATSAIQAAAIRAAGAVDSSNFYGSRDDREDVNADMFTAKVEHELGAGTTVRNITRYGKSQVNRVLTSVSALNGSNVANLSDPSTWTVGRSRQRIDQLNEILVNQLSINSDRTLAGMKHSFVGGLELIHERQKTKGFTSDAALIRGVNYAAIANPPANLYNPNASDALGIPYATGVETDGSTTTIGAYALDTVDISPALKLNGGLRLDHFSTSTKSGTLINTSALVTANPGYALGGIAPSSLTASDNLFSWNLGVVYKPTANGSVYAAIANSLTPPGGNNFALSTSATSQDNGSLDPQEARTIEVGTKWDLLDAKLNVSAALYRTENDKQTSVDAFTGQTLQFGKTRVDGLEFAAVGQITNFWQVSAGLAFMDAKQIKQFSSTSESNGVRWSPDMTASIWTSYTAGDLTIGGGVRHMSDQKRVIVKGANLSTESMPKIPSYSLVDLMAAYKVTKNVNLQLNVYNLFDKEYIAKLNNNGSRYTPGAPRTVNLTASVKF